MASAFPPKGRLHHHVPGWVPEGATFHVRIRCNRGQNLPLTNPALAERILQSVRQYHDAGRWWCRLFLLMPDHLHTLLVFPPAPVMSRTIREWKSYHARTSGIDWQGGFFDHRVRNPKELDVKADYIRQNPLVKGLCRRTEDWPWKIELRDLDE